MDGYQRVIDAPHDAEARLAWAEALTRQGDERRAAFVRQQIALADARPAGSPSPWGPPPARAAL